ncbi:sulfurtransferase [Aquisalimonas sp.]|uniref:sulfurtransferase n=1 Tax=Aquisalimonas sp. TaxID=1872621 RepID=UPI0025C02691|nr:sulfurtransferase [Aquisalimonas sp.]
MLQRVFVFFAVIGVLIPALAGARTLDPLISVDWLEKHLGEDDLVVLDVRSDIDGSDREDFKSAHIPGAVYSNYTTAGWRETRGGVPGKLPPEEDLAELIGGLGIGNDTDVVIVPAGVGSTDFGSAARVYWTFKILGHDQVSILNGGHQAWVDAGHPVASGWNEPEPTDFEPDFRPDLLADADDVSAAANAGYQLVDNRPGVQFRGGEKHPASRSPGTIPGSLNLEEQKLTDDGTAFFVDEETLQALMQESGVDGERSTITFCNTGHWAAMGWFALSEIAGQEDVALYDGSMVDWTQEDNRPLKVH